ncbi:MAG: TRAP transporter large permease subunit [bacterium]|nr:TRAP transporter large permease subunit [bacterium]
MTAFLVVFLLALFPTMEVIARKFFNTGVPASGNYTHHLVLVLTFIGGMITSREGAHLSLALDLDIKEVVKKRMEVVIAIMSSMIAFAFAISSLSFTLISFDWSQTVGFIPMRLIGLVMFVGFAVIAVRFVLAIPGGGKRRLFAWFGIPMGFCYAYDPFLNILMTIGIMEEPTGLLAGLQNIYHSINGFVAYPFIIILIAAALFGARIFIVLGGIGYILFAKTAQPLEVIPNEAYSLLVSHTIPAIPLFTVAGFILSESKAGERLVKLFKSLFAWFPGGLAVMAILVCTFFTTFTGASGVTILALGGLLIYVLQEGNYERRFNVGLLTASGSVGLMFPPSLPIIIYGVTAGVSIKDMFIGGLIPGFVMVMVLVVYGMLYAKKKVIPREPFKIKETLIALKESVWEILLPVIVVLGYFGGYTTLVESGAIAVIYTFISQVFIHRDLKIKQLPDVILKSIPIIGGVLIILAMAKGLSYFMVDAEIPMRLAEWMQANIGSKYVFLLLLNVALLITGCFMDIFSAILVVVPLIIPLGEVFGIHPVHLGIIFLANMELGYLTPPVGLNLFLSSYRFNEPMVSIYKDVMPFFFIQFISVLLITYIPFLSTALVGG